VPAALALGGEYTHCFGCFLTRSLGDKNCLVLRTAGPETLGQRLRKEGRLHVDMLQRFGEDLMEAVKYLKEQEGGFDTLNPLWLCHGRLIPSAVKIDPTTHKKANSPMDKTLLGLFLFIPTTLWAADKPKPVKVFILAGQSNMEGKAKMSLVDYQATQSKTSDVYKHLRKGDKWIEREDVWIKFLDRKGNLTVGYGSPRCIGPELEFGTVVGDHYGEQVLLIKTAWGGRSVYRDFRSPSAGLPKDEVLEKMLAEQKKKKPETTIDDIKKPFGAAYRDMLTEINDTLTNLKKHFPGYADQGYELAGFIWLQGWNDMINAEYTAEHTANLTHFIRDVRKDLKSPKLPFVIGQMGVDGLNAGANVKKFKDAQAAVMEVAEFKSNVALVKTDVFWDTDAEAVFKKGWKENIEEWNKVGSDYPYHYLGSGKTMLKMGHAFAEAVLELRGEKKPR